MTLFSKLSTISFIPKSVSVFSKRGIRFPYEGVPTNPYPYIHAFAAEPHGGHAYMRYIFYAMFLVVIPAVSVYVGYEEYEEKFVHKKRLPFPKQDFLHQGVQPFKWGDGKHSLMHHPFFNFTPNGYETDKDGNPLPPGVYAME